MKTINLENAWFCETIDQIPPVERTRGCRMGNWHYGRLYGKDLIGDDKRMVSVLGWTICRCTGVRVIGQGDNYLYEKDVLQDHNGNYYIVLFRNEEFVLMDITEGSEYFSIIYDLEGYVLDIENSEGDLKLVGTVFGIHECHLSYQKAAEMASKRERTEELLQYLIAESTSQNIVPVFVDEDGEEQYIDHPDTLALINSILEQAYLPFIAQKVIEAGYRMPED